MVNVGCCWVVIPCLVCAAAVPCGVVVADGSVVPSQTPTELIPLAIAALVGGTPAHGTAQHSTAIYAFFNILYS